MFNNTSNVDTEYNFDDLETANLISQTIQNSNVEHSRIETSNVQRSRIKTSTHSLEMCCLKFIIWILIAVFIFPFAFGDLYFAYNDSSCVNEPAEKLAINLKDYLLVYGWMYMSILGAITIVIFCTFTKTDFNSFNNIIDCFLICGASFTTLLIIISYTFGLIWNILGAIIFGGLMDTSGCEKSIYNYVFASLIIKLFFFSYCGICKKNKDKNEK